MDPDPQKCGSATLQVPVTNKNHTAENDRSETTWYWLLYQLLKTDRASVQYNSMVWSTFVDNWIEKVHLPYSAITSSSFENL